MKITSKMEMIFEPLDKWLPHKFTQNVSQKSSHTQTLSHSGVFLADQIWGPIIGPIPNQKIIDIFRIQDPFLPIKSP